MTEDRLLVQRMQRGEPTALRRIYEKYKDDLLTIGTWLLADVTAAEDVLHDVFVNFAGRVSAFDVRSNLRGYLVACVANRARDRMRQRSFRPVSLANVGEGPGTSEEPSSRLIRSEEDRRLYQALAELPEEQREVITLHVHGDMRFREIAQHQAVSIHTVQSRYRYGVEKLRSSLDGWFRQ